EAGHIGEHDEFVCLERLRHRRGGQVGVDIERFPGLPIDLRADRADDGHPSVVEQFGEHGGVDRRDLAHPAEVDGLAADLGAGLVCQQQVRVLTGQTDRGIAVLVDAGDDVAVDLADRTMRMTSAASSVVTRCPALNSDSMPNRSSIAEIWGSPPWTTTGRMPAKRRKAMSSAKDCCSSGETMALPPYLMTIVAPEKVLIHGSASVRASALTW